MNLPTVMLGQGFKQPISEKKWIQAAFKDVKKRGTEGKCTGSKFGGPSCPPGSKAYNMAKNLRKIAKK